MTLQTALDVLEQEHAPAYRSRQLTHAVYSELAERWDEVSALPRPLRERLERDAPLRTLSEEAPSAPTTARSSCSCARMTATRSRPSP